MKSWKVIVATCASVAAMGSAPFAHADTRNATNGNGHATEVRHHSSGGDTGQGDCVGPNSFCKPYFGN